MKTILLNIIRPPLILIARLAFLLLVLPVLYLIEPFKKIRFHLVYTKRIGHLSGNTDLFLRRLQIGLADPNSLYILAGIDPVNRQLYEMLKRELLIIESPGLTRFLFYIRPIIQRTRFWEFMKWEAPGYQEFNQGHASLTFEKEEEARGQGFLRSLGIGDDDWFVCLHNRDAAYLDNYMPEEKKLWRTRDFRNCSINNYMDAAEYITSKGGYVLRMGAIVQTPLPENRNPKIIDYASEHRTDFLDIYLPSKCLFFLGCDSGIFVIATIFDVPVALANCNLIAYNPFRHNDLFLLTRLREKATGKFITYDKALELGYYKISKAAPVLPEYEVVENDAEQILEMTKQMLQQLDGKAPSNESFVANAIYRERYVSKVPYSDLAANLGAKFAEKHIHLFQAETDDDTTL